MNSNFPVHPPLSDAAPRFDPGFFGALARRLLRLHGWRITGTFPDHHKVVMAGFPHTSNWDGYYAILFVLALGLRISLIIKKSWMDGAFGRFLAWMNFIGVDRQNPAGFARQVAAEFNSHESFWLGVTPEGTRTNAQEIKTGFHRIARAAEAVIVPVCIDFDNKYIRVLPAMETTEDAAADTQRLLDCLAGNAWPHHPEKLSAPAREALTRNGELVRARPLDH